MISLSLIELNSTKVNNSSFRHPFPPNAFSFMTSASLCDHKNVVSDVSNELFQGKYGLKNKYTILFLYDFLEDQISRDFIATYGGKLHNASSINITILTYFSAHMARDWNNVQFRDGIGFGNSEDSYRVMDIIQGLQHAYKIKQLPAAVIIKKGNDEKEESLNIDLSSYKKKEDLYMIFKEMIETINDNCEEDFPTISRKILGTDSYINKDSTMSYFNTSNYVADLVKEKNNTLLDLALELGISERGLRNKRNNNSFTRDECFYIAIRFGISIKDLNELLRVNDHHELAFEGRDGIIRKSLFDRDDVDTTSQKLKEKGYKGIIKEIQ